MSLWGFLLGLILLTAWVVSAGYLTQANVFLTDFKSTDVHLDNAYNFSFWGAFVTWGLIALFVLLVILSIFGVITFFDNAGEYWSTTLFFIVAFALVGTMGGLAIATSLEMEQSPNFHQDNSKLVTAKSDCVISASISIGTLGVLILAGILYFALWAQTEVHPNALTPEQQQLLLEELEIEKLRDLRLEETGNGRGRLVSA